jgi:hypothetical protein
MSSIFLFPFPEFRLLTSVAAAMIAAFFMLCQPALAQSGFILRSNKPVFRLLTFFWQFPQNF